VCDVMGISERRACRAIGQPRSTQRHERKVPDDEERLIGQIIRLATQYGRYGYRRITALLRGDGWKVNHKRVERIWRREGLKVPQKQPKRGRLWLNDGSCIRLRPERKDHVWSYDMVMERTSDGRPLRILAIIDEYTRECLALHVARRIRSGDVLDQLYELFLRRGLPEYIRSDNGPEFAAKAVRKWLNRLDVTTLFIEPGSPWENGYIESFNGKMRDELLNGEVLDTLEEAKVLVEAWRRVYNRIRPHSSLGYRPPAPEAHVVGKFTLGLAQC
jgi:putative transposase